VLVRPVYSSGKMLQCPWQGLSVTMIGNIAGNHSFKVSYQGCKCPKGLLLRPKISLVGRIATRKSTMLS